MIHMGRGWNRAMATALSRTLAQHGWHDTIDIEDYVDAICVRMTRERADYAVSLIAKFSRHSKVANGIYGEVYVSAGNQRLSAKTLGLRDVDDPAIFGERLAVAVGEACSKI